MLLYAGGAVAGIAGLGALLTRGSGDDGFAGFDSKERASIGMCRCVQLVAWCFAVNLLAQVACEWCTRIGRHGSVY